MQKCGRAMYDGVTGTSCAVLRPRAASLEDSASFQLTWPAGLARTDKHLSPAKQRSAVARLRTSDQRAVEEFFNACYPRLAGWVRRLVDDDETAHEIASEAFTRPLSRWSRLDKPQH